MAALCRRGASCEEANGLIRVSSFSQEREIGLLSTGMSRRPISVAAEVDITRLQWVLRVGLQISSLPAESKDSLDDKNWEFFKSQLKKFVNDHEFPWKTDTTLRLIAYQQTDSDGVKVSFFAKGIARGAYGSNILLYSHKDGSPYVFERPLTMWLSKDAASTSRTPSFRDEPGIKEWWKASFYRADSEVESRESRLKVTSEAIVRFFNKETKAAEKRRAKEAAKKLQRAWRKTLTKKRDRR